MLSIDRIEEGYAVCCEGDDIKNIPLSRISGEFAEGDILVEQGDGYTSDKALTDERRKRILEKEKDLWE